MIAQSLQKLKGSLSRRFGSQDLVAVDFDSRSIRAVSAQRSAQQVKLGRLRTQPMPEGIDLANAPAVGAALGAALKKMHLSASHLVMSVSRAQAVLKPLKLPAGTRDGEMASMVRYQVEKELPFRLEEAVIDFTVETQPTGGANGGEGIDVLVAAVQVPVVDFYRQVALAAGGKLLRLGLRPYANACCLRRHGDLGSGDTVAMVVITADQTEINVLSGDTVAFSRSVAIKAAGNGNDQPPAMQVTGEVLRSLQSYQTLQGSSKITSVIVTGGTGLEPTVRDQLAARLGAPCGGLELPESLNGQGASGEGCTAVGLAEADGGADAPFDFVHPKRPAVFRDVRKQRRQLATAAVVLALIASFAAGHFHLDAKRQDVARLNARVTELEKKNKSQVAPLRANLQKIQKWVDDDSRWLDHLAQLSVSGPGCTQGYVSKFEGKADGTLAFTLQSNKDKDIIDELRAVARSMGYGFTSNGPNSRERDPLNYNHRYTFQMPVAGAKIELTALAAATQPSRPDDDATNDPSFRVASYRPPSNTPPRPEWRPERRPEPTPGPTPQARPDWRQPQPQPSVTPAPRWGENNPRPTDKSGDRGDRSNRPRRPQ